MKLLEAQKSKRQDTHFMSNAIPKEDSDEALIARICLSDHEALEILYKRYFQKIFRFTYRTLRSLDDIEEIINDVMFVVWKKASTFNNQVLVSTWIFGIAYKKCLKVLSKRVQSEHICIDDMVEGIPEMQVGTLKELEIEDWVSVVFSKLPADQRVVLELVYHQGLGYSEIATIMECPENTVKTRMFHARKKIKTLFPDLIDDLQFEYNEGKLL